MRRQQISHPMNSVIYETFEPIPMKGGGGGFGSNDFLEDDIQIITNHGVGSAKGHQYEFMQDPDPCTTCKSKTRCGAVQAVCRAFDEYVETGKYNPDDRVNPVADGLETLTKGKGHWRTRIFT